MFWHSILPLLALPAVLAELVARDTCPPLASGKDRRSYSFGSKSPYSRHHLSLDEICDRDTITLEGNLVDDPICINEPNAKSIIPGFPGDRSGSYCLLKYDDFYCKCVKDVVVVDFKEDEQPDCIPLTDSTYSSYSWVRRCGVSP
jgi:hypothetical protein